MRKRFQASTDKIWFTSDTHFGHSGIVPKRPFNDEMEMDWTMEDNWNQRVGKRDHIFILGDFSFHSRKETMQLAKRLHGIKYLIEGNHDRMIANNPSEIFEGGVEKYHEVWVDKTKLVLCHFAFRSWNLMHYGSWNLHGHSHGNLASHRGKQLDVGVDCVGAYYPERAFSPLSFDEIKAYLDAKPIYSDDHHQPKEEPQS